MIVVAFCEECEVWVNVVADYLGYGDEDGRSQYEFLHGVTGGDEEHLMHDLSVKQ